VAWYALPHDRATAPKSTTGQEQPCITYAIRRRAATVTAALTATPAQATLAQDGATLKLHQAAATTG
jgi:hypothetical protein